jgi:hypothetical protein
MGPSFGRVERTPLRYELRAHANPGAWTERAWLLWPAWAYRVVAPAVRPRRLNVLQKAVLAILIASHLTAREIADRLAIHPELAAFVITELQAQGRVAEDGSVTDRGREALAEEREDAADLIAAWVFQDPWSGSLWPFVASSLEPARTELDANGRPQLLLGTTGKSYFQRLWVQSAPDDRPAPPDARQILSAALRGRRAERRAARQELWVADEPGDPSDDPNVSLDRLSLIESKPTAVSLVTYLYVPHGGETSDIDWHACDFFGRGTNPELKRRVLKVADQDENLARVLDRFLRGTVHASLDDYRRAAGLRRQGAQRILSAALTLDVERHDVSRWLISMLDAWLEVRDLEDGATESRYRSVLMDGRSALESVLAETADRWPLAGVADVLYVSDGKGSDGARFNMERIERAAGALGFLEIPDSLLHVKKGDVKATYHQNANWRLRPLIVATLLKAEREADHPFRRAAPKAPDLLTRMERVAKAGGEAAHHGKGSTPDMDGLNRCVEDVLAIVAAILGLPSRSLQEVLVDEQEA